MGTDRDAAPACRAEASARRRAASAPASQRTPPRPSRRTSATAEHATRFARCPAWCLEFDPSLELGCLELRFPRPEEFPQIVRSANYAKCCRRVNRPYGLWALDFRLPIRPLAIPNRHRHSYSHEERPMPGRNFLRNDCIRGRSAGHLSHRLDRS